MSSILAEVEKSPNDDREYRAVQLTKNGLFALLVSDPAADKAAASMCVNTGSWSDGDVRGLAHFCEHMCFMGTDLFPDVNEYSAFLNAHGGMSNAFTMDVFTNYFFDVSPDSLRGALERFSRFFVAPMFDKDSTDKEIQAVDNEHSKNMQADVWREMELLRMAVNPAHPMSRFSTGNAHTLRDEPREAGMDIREILLDFHRRHYSANLMRLVVYGKEPLDVLQSSAEELFSDIENRDAVSTEDEIAVDAFLDEMLPKILYQIPVMEDRKVQALWALPSVYGEVYSKPLSYFSHLFGHEGAGSLLSYLKKKGWANGISAGQYQNHKAYSVFVCEVECTPEGMANRKDVIEAIFSYAEMLRKAGPQQWIHEELKKLKMAEFEFLQKSEPINYVMSLTMKGYKVPMPEVLKCDHIVTDFKPELLEKLAECFRPEKFIVLISAPEFEFELSDELPYYGGKYMVTPVDPELRTRWSSPAEIPDLRLPEPNPFLTDDFGLVAAPAEVAPIPSIHESGCIPNHIHDDGVIDVYYKHDDTFKIPKGAISLKLKTHEIMSSPSMQMSSELFVEMLKEALNEVGYQALCANLGYDISTGRGGITISMSGFSQKLPRLLQAILEYFASDEVLQDSKEVQQTFKRVKETLVRDLKNRNFDQPYQFCFNARNVAFVTPFWSYAQKLRCSEQLTLADVRHFRNIMMRGMRALLLVHGNFDIPKVKEVYGVLKDRLFPSLEAKVDAGAVASAPEGRVVDLLASSSEFRTENGLSYRLGVRHPNPEEPNSCCFVETYLGEYTIETWAKAKLMTNLMREPAFNQLRSEEQLGYIVHTTDTKLLHKSIFLSIIVQSNSAPPEYLQARIFSFLDKFKEELEAMDDTVFESTKAGTIEDTTKKATSLNKQSRQMWGKMETGVCMFEYKFKAARLMESITKDDMLDMLRTQFLPNRARVNVVLQVASSNFKLAGEEGYEDQLAEWKKKHEELGSSASLNAYEGGPFLDIKDPFAFKARTPLQGDFCPVEEVYDVVGSLLG